MLESSTSTKYAVARRTTIISDGYDDVDTAQRQLDHIADTMAGVGLKPDVHLVEVEVETMVGKPKAYVPPVEGEAEPDTDDPAPAASLNQSGE